jgi:hypothetical protein
MGKQSVHDMAGAANKYLASNERVFPVAGVHPTLSRPGPCWGEPEIASSAAADVAADFDGVHTYRTYAHACMSRHS